MRLSSVDLPEPDGPMTETIWPRGMVRETSSRAVTCRLPSNRLDTRSRSIIASDYVKAFTSLSIASVTFLLNTGVGLWLIADHQKWFDQPRWAMALIACGLTALLAGFALDRRKRSR